MSNATSPALTALDADGEEFTLDFGFPVVPVRTAEDAAARKALLQRQDIAAGIAYGGALASGLSKKAARHAAAKARRETA